MYLAYGLLRAGYLFAERATRPLGFGHGLLLNLSNPKLIVYALSLFATFLAPLVGSAGLLVVAALLLAAVSACASAVWALFGAGIKARLREARFARWVNLGLAVLLLYVALDLAHLLPTLR